MRRPGHWAHMQYVPLRRLGVMLLAVFLLFSVTGFYFDLMTGGREPYLGLMAAAAFGGLNAVVWILVLARLPTFCIFILAGLEFFNRPANIGLAVMIDRIFHPAQVPSEQGIHFAATCTLLAVLGSYVCFVAYIRGAGKEAIKLRAELELAHSIQKTLVPPIARETTFFEIYGISKPSERVGGDLVDVVELERGDTVAYLADVAGHGLQAGILMGMLKTAARTALLDAGTANAGGATLSMLMERLNRVLPGVKEPHMYATFTALRLDADGASFYGMAASPPMVIWSVADRSIRRLEEEQFPLGLLPVQGFASGRLSLQPGDVAVIATDGILEVCGGAKGRRQAFKGAEFGVEGLEQLMMDVGDMPLAKLAASILNTVREYGAQLDDQTLLLVRRRG
ncbi:MAG TPA: SpoIIE family protein phosphatase [Acidobacteriaceae bacterium]